MSEDFGYRALAHVETDADSQLMASSLASLPLGALLLHLHVCLMFATDSGVRDEVSGGLAALGDLVRHAAPGGCRSSGSERIDAVLRADPDGSATDFMVAYGQFAQLMPEVHRGLWRVEQPSETHFVITRDAELLDREAQDIVLSHLGQGLSVGVVDVESACLALVRGGDSSTAGGLRPAFSASARDLLRRLFRIHMASMREPEVLRDADFSKLVDVSREAFRTIQAAVFAVGDVCRGFSRAHLAVRTGDDAVGVGPGFEWASLRWPETDFMDLIAELASVGRDLAEKALRPFVWDPSRASAGDPFFADGLFPPLVRCEGVLIVNGEALRTYVHVRNLVYLVRRQDPQRYNEEIASCLEAALLDEVEDVLRGEGRTCWRNVGWAGGEIDLLAFEPATKTALQIQAKAGISSQGARMVARLQDEMWTGVEQLERFENAGSAVHAAVVSGLCGYTVEVTTLRSGLVGRAAFGSAWEAQGAVTLMTPGLLRVLQKSRPADGKPLSLGTLDVDLRELVGRMLRDIGVNWVAEPLNLGAIRIDRQQLRWDVLRLTQWQANGAVPARAD